MVVSSMMSAQLQGVPNLSQNTNYFLEQTTRGLTFIGSIDGLNIYDGLHTKVYKPSTHNMFGTNMQSPFFEMADGSVWFCTYEAIHRYDPKKDDFEYWFLQKNGEDIKFDYRIIRAEDCLLWVLVDGVLYFFDTSTFGVVAHIKAELMHSVQNAVLDLDQTTILVGLQKDSLGSVFTRLLVYNKNLVFQKKIELPFEYFMVKAHGSEIWFGNRGGALFVYNVNEQAIVAEMKIAERTIMSLHPKNDSIWLVTSLGSISEVNINSKQKVNEFIIKNPSTGKTIRNHGMSIVTKDGTFWCNGDGEGVFYKNIVKQKFEHFLGEQSSSQVSVTKIHQIRQDSSFIITSRLNGILHMDRSGKILHHLQSVENVDNFTSLESIMLDDNRLLFYAPRDFYIYNLADKKATKLQNLSSPNFRTVYSLQKYGDKLICSTSDSSIVQLEIFKDQLRLTPFTNYRTNNKFLNQVHIIDHQFLISVNEEYIECMSYDKVSGEMIPNKRLTIPGGISCIYHKGQNHFYLGNTKGIFEVNSESLEFRQLMDEQELLSQTIYSITQDTSRNLWLTSNNGIIKYNLDNNEAYAFNESDGIQSKEFNTNAFLQLPDGKIYVGGINGLNAYYPDKVSLSERQVPVYVSDYRINDTVSTSLGAASHVDGFELPYSSNTLSFSFHAIDYSDIQSTRVRYKLEGVDDDFVRSDQAQGFARYANLAPGDYTLHLQGSNADQVWNKNVKTINFSILPPYWMTWWFRTGLILSLGSMLFGGVRYYYRQQLKQKDFELREQGLLIEKQEALQNERTRIAGEMHDDLGGGLTTIRFLSHKLMQAVENSSAKEVVEKISNQTQTLVTNMSEIIWAMNSGHDTVDNFSSYTRKYAKEFLDHHGWKLIFNIVGNTQEVPLSGERRRNLFLVVKEALHNAIKHSGGNTFEIEICVGQKFSLRLKDNGHGYNITELTRGHGLNNMEKRITNLQGELKVNDSSNGVEIMAKLSLEIGPPSITNVR